MAPLFGAPVGPARATTGLFGPERASAGFNPSPLLALLQRVRGGMQPHQVGGPMPNPGIHWFGPGGSGVSYPGDEVLPSQPGGPMLPGPAHPGHLLPMLGGHPGGSNQFGPAEQALKAGNVGEAAQLWEQHHPGAVGRDQIPAWVEKGLAQDLHGADGGSSFHGQPNGVGHPDNLGSFHSNLLELLQHPAVQRLLARRINASRASGGGRMSAL